MITDKSNIAILHLQDMDKVSYDSELEQWRVISIIEALKMKAGELELLPDWRGWRRSGRQACFFLIL